MRKRVLAACVFVPILFVVMFFLPPVAMGITAAFIASGAAFELLRATANETAPWAKFVVCLCAAIIPMGFLFGETQGRNCTYLLTLFLLFMAFACAIRAYDSEKPVMVEWVLLALFGGILLPLLLSSLVTLKCLENGKFWVMLPVLLAFFTDGGAYFSGVLFGKHKGITRVSPHKSLEGYVGGVLSGIGFSLLYGLVLQLTAGLTVGFPALALCGLTGGFATELGDLSFSLIKRQYGVKDYGHLIPGHGGMLDRFDSMFFCAPVVYLLSLIFPAML